MPTCDFLLEFLLDACPSKSLSLNKILLPEGSLFLKEFQYPDVLTSKVNEIYYSATDLVLHVFKMKLGNK